MKNIVLTGFMASGKSTVGRGLAQKLNRPFVDTDRLIEAEQGLQIKDIFAQSGEPYFRKLETAAVRQVCQRSGQVIATGGGIVLHPENMELFRQNGVIIFLYAGIEKIIQNISGGTLSRPVANGKSAEELAEILEIRLPYYRNCDIEIDTTHLDISETIAAIEQKIQKNVSSDTLS